jgi:CheY-specific phosphatase CheX
VKSALATDPNVIRRFLLEALSEILETLAYTVPCEELPASALAELQAITAEIPFLGSQGSQEGSVTVTASRSVAVRLAMSLSGLDADELAEREDLVEDAMRESANMAAGIFLRRAATGDDQFRLGLPHIARDRPRPGFSECVGISVTVNTVEGPVGLDLELRVGSRAAG